MGTTAASVCISATVSQTVYIVKCWKNKQERLWLKLHFGFDLQHTVQGGSLPYASGAAGGIQNGDHLANPTGVTLQQMKVVEKDVGQTFNSVTTGISVGSQAVEQQTVRIHTSTF